jgi:hypothetical protein
LAIFVLRVVRFDFAPASPGTPTNNEVPAMATATTAATHAFRFAVDVAFGSNFRITHRILIGLSSWQVVDPVLGEQPSIFENTMPSTISSRTTRSLVPFNQASLTCQLRQVERQKRATENAETIQSGEQPEFKTGIDSGSLPAESATFTKDPTRASSIPPPATGALLAAGTAAVKPRAKQ